MIDGTQVVVAEANQDMAFIALGYTYNLAYKRFADEHVVASPPDVAFGAYPPRLMVSVVPGVLDFRGHLSGRGAPNLRRRSLAQRFMGALLVEVPAKVIEALLLLARCCCSWAAGLCLQGPVHPLMPSIVLRRGGATEARLDAQLEQPYRQPRKTTRADRAKRTPPKGS